MIESAFKSSTDEVVWQHQQLGTGHALKCFLDQTTVPADNLLVLCADTPLLDGKLLKRFYADFFDRKLNASCISFNTGDPTGYGRVVKLSKGLKIVEEKDADPLQKKISMVNSGIYLFKKDFLTSHIDKLETNNSQNEFYLTDLFRDEEGISSFNFEEGEKALMGVNDLIQQAEAAKLLRQKKIETLQLAGVIFESPDSCSVHDTVEVGAGTVIGPNVELREKTIIGENCKVDSGCILTNTEVKSGGNILPYSVLEGAIVKNGASVGPFARLRAGAQINENAKIGNFVEIKKSVISSGAKVSHLSYVGDAEIGERSNIGCGFISCNYDGKNKYKTIVGEDCFIGSDTQMVAPVEVGDNCFVASGTTVTKDMPSGSFGISRASFEVKENMAKRFIKK
ncbi:MAG: UDP-N-acetylglucosamine diphosphorylase/glucosamine-1-phosphate N-acetyltransferase [Halobacteriovoraceae bacterium]|nr:UDP-N-acetylglucosamine diphosphorylase/glucosamine-1-phosphate N-acetyltransferase [Halobacteriovoraceae bacterium]